MGDRLLFRGVCPVTTEQLTRSKPTASERDRAMDITRPLTPRSEMRRSSYGSLEMSLQTSPGLCRGGRKCVKRDGHNGTHYPKD